MWQFRSSRRFSIAAATLMLSLAALTFQRASASSQTRPSAGQGRRFTGQVLSASGAFLRGTITKGINPLDGSALDGEPADNITPLKVLAAVRFTEPRGRWWAEYRVRTQPDVTRVTPTLLTSPFRIAQDLLSLDGFTVQRVGWGVALTRSRDQLSLIFAVENLANKYYREHFQFAPARGRSFTVGVSAGTR